MKGARPLHGVEVQAARFEAILETARDAIISINANGIITLFNRAAEEIFGYEASAVIGRNVGILMPSPHRENHDRYIHEYERTGEAKAIGRIRKVDGVRRNGETFPLELSISEVRVGGEVMYTGVVRDVSARARDEAELERLRQLSLQRQRLADIGALTAKIVHDLANPLAALSMVSQGILRRIERTPEEPIESVRASAERLVGTVERLDSLLREFKDFARGQRLELHEVDLGEILGALDGLWRSEAVAREVELSVRTPAPPIRLRADPEKLHRVFDNLVKNGLEAIEEGPGRLEIDVEALPSGMLRLHFQDSGPGLPAGIDVFALFETTKATGTGLGLPICRQIVEAHGGSIDADRGELGGARFTIELPLHGPPLA